MRKSFQNFNKKLYKLFRYFNFSGKKYVNQNNQNNTNNTNTNNTQNNMESIIIQRGHYKSVNSGDGSKQSPIETIKILGEDPNIPGNWLIDELIKRNGISVNKSLSEYELKNNWILIDVSLTENKTVFPKSLLMDLEDVSEINNHYIPDNENIAQNIPLYKPSIKNYQEEIIPVFQIPEDEKFIHNVLSKIKIPQKESIELKIRIPIDYNFNKLKEIINLLNLEKNKVVNFILSNKETQLLINEKMKDKIFEMLIEENIEISKESNLIQTTSDIKNIEVIEPIILKSEIIPVEISEINQISKISNIEDPRLLELTNKLSKLF